MNQTRIAFLPNCQAKAQMVSQAPLNIGKLKGHRKEVANSVSLLTPIQFASRGREGEAKTKKPQNKPQIKTFSTASTSFSAIDTITRQEGPVTCYKMLGKCLGTTWPEGKRLLLFSRLGTGKGWQVLPCWAHSSAFLWSTERLQEGTSGLRSTARAGSPGTVTTLQAPSALLQRLQHAARFAAVQGAEEAFSPSSMPSQPTHFFHSCHSAPKAHPFEITIRLFLPAPAWLWPDFQHK